MKQKIDVIIQARMNSARLPNKALLKIGDMTMLEHVINQVKHAKTVRNVIVATTNSKKDDRIINFCKRKNFIFFRGSEKDVLNRYYRCSQKFDCDPVVRISSDCPFIDPEIIDMASNLYFKNSFDYVSNNIAKINKKWENSLCKFPHGMVIEVSNFKSLERAWKNAKKPSEREHVFPFIQFNSKIFKISNFSNDKDLSFIRCTVDKKEDLKFVRELWKRMSKSKKIINISDIEMIVNKEPSLIQLNNSIPFDEGYQKSVKKDLKFLHKKAIRTN